MTSLPVSTFKPYFVILRENLGTNFSKIKSTRFIIYVYWVRVWIYSVYMFLEVCFLKFNLQHLVLLRLCIVLLNFL